LQSDDKKNIFKSTSFNDQRMLPDAGHGKPGVTQSQTKDFTPYYKNVFHIIT
jgi:hypothetical protein